MPIDYVYLSQEGKKWVVNVDTKGQQVYASAHDSKEEAVLLATAIYPDYALSDEIKNHQKGTK